MMQPLALGWVDAWEPIVGRAWEDEEFKKRLLTEPSAIFKEHGVETAPGVKLKVLENTESVIHLTVPTKPDVAFTREEIESAALDSYLDQQLWGVDIIHLAVTAATDDNLKTRLKANPAAVLKENGLDVPDNLEIRVVENTPTQYCLTLPAKPDHEPVELSDEDLSRVVGGSRIGGSIWYGAKSKYLTRVNPVYRSNYNLFKNTNTKTVRTYKQQ
jgi:hypothetical protein